MAWGLVQSAKAVPASTTSIAKAFTSNVTSGNRLFIFVDTIAESDVNTPTDSQNLTYTRLVQNNYSSQGVIISLWTAVTTASSANTVTVARTGSAQLGFTISEYSGLNSSAGTGCVDVSATGAGVSDTTAPSSGITSATHAADQLALTMVGDWGNNATWTAPAGFAKDANASINTNTTCSIGVASKNSASGATEGGNWGGGNTSGNAQCAWIVVLKLSGDAVPIAFADAGAGATTTVAVAVAASVSDAGAGADTLRIVRPLAVGDSGTGADSLTVAVTVPYSDAGAGTTTATVAVTVPYSDAGAATTTATVAVIVSYSDAGVGVDSEAITIPIVYGDTGVAADSLTRAPSTSGPYYAITAIDLANGSGVWVNPTYALTDDALVATWVAP